MPTVSTLPSVASRILSTHARVDIVAGEGKCFGLLVDDPRRAPPNSDRNPITIPQQLLLFRLHRKVDLADEETESQRVLGALLIVLTVSLFVVAVAECLWEARRLSEGARDDDDDAHVFLRRREGKGKDGAMGDDKFKTGGALYAPKLLDVPMNRVRVNISVFALVDNRWLDSDG